jgi:hypothetical protein
MVAAAGFAVATVAIAAAGEHWRPSGAAVSIADSGAAS